MMASDVGDRPNTDASDAADRYRQAAEHALDQLDWTVKPVQDPQNRSCSRARQERCVDPSADEEQGFVVTVVRRCLLQALE
jgi:hypothetical protein